MVERVRRLAGIALGDAVESGRGYPCALACKAEKAVAAGRLSDIHGRAFVTSSKLGNGYGGELICFDAPKGQNLEVVADAGGLASVEVALGWRRRTFRCSLCAVDAGLAERRHGRVGRAPDLSQIGWDLM